MYETIWEFKTLNHSVALQVAPEMDDPADSFDNAEDVEQIRDGSIAWFVARVVVYKCGVQIGCDYLSACAYRTVQEFYTSHRTSPAEYRNTLVNKARNRVICHYFPSMVSEAIAAARGKLRCLAA